MTHVTCGLTAENRDQLRNSTLGNRVWATFTFLPPLSFPLQRLRGLGSALAPPADPGRARPPNAFFMQFTAQNLLIY